MISCDRSKDIWVTDELLEEVNCLHHDMAGRRRSDDSSIIWSIQPNQDVTACCLLAVWQALQHSGQYACAHLHVQTVMNIGVG